MADSGELMFCVTEEDIQCVREYYGKSEEEIKEDCDLIRDWMKQQNHFPDDYDPQRAERFLLRNKFRLERTKQKLENYYTGRGVNIQQLRSMDPAGAGMQNYLKTVSFIPLPKLNNNKERIYVQRFTGNNYDYSFEYNYLFVLAALEMELRHDYAIGFRVIVDLEGFSLTHLRKYGVNQIRKAVYMLQENYSARILGVEYINAPFIVHLLLAILRLAVPAKLFKKITVHENFESLKSVIPAEHLPSDYDGKLRSIAEIYEDFKQFLLENRDYLMNRVEVVSDESKRVSDIIKNHKLDS